MMPQNHIVECPLCYNTHWMITETGNGPTLTCTACSQTYPIEKLVNLEGVQ